MATENNKARRIKRVDDAFDTIISEVEQSELINAPALIVGFEKMRSRVKTAVTCNCGIAEAKLVEKEKKQKSKKSNLNY